MLDETREINGIAVTGNFEAAGLLALETLLLIASGDDEDGSPQPATPAVRACVARNSI